MKGDRSASSSTLSRKYATFRNRLNCTEFSAVVFDYDGTLVATNARSDPPIEEMTERLVDLLRAGIPIGIATGRGDSARQQLQPIIPCEFQARVLLGYHNASQIARLDVSREVDGDFLDPILERFSKRFLRSSIHAEGVAARNYPWQVSIRPFSGHANDKVMDGSPGPGYGGIRRQTKGHGFRSLPRCRTQECIEGGISVRYIRRIWS